jgi:hypothetical protein
VLKLWFEELATDATQWVVSPPLNRLSQEATGAIATNFRVRVGLLFFLFLLRHLLKDNDRLFRRIRAVALTL